MELNNYDREWAWSIFQFGYPDYSLVPPEVLRQVAWHHQQEADRLRALALTLDSREA